MACRDCFSGHIHTSTPVGKEEIIHGVPSYVATPEEGVKPKGLVVIISDAYGWDFVNTRLLADRYAKKGGFLVYVPDFMMGHSLNPESMETTEKLKAPAGWFTTLIYKPIWLVQAIMTVIPWLYFTRVAAVQPLIKSFLTSIRKSPPPYPTENLKIGLAGFCWGGRHAFLLSANPPSSQCIPYSSDKLEALIHCAFTAHPSMLKLPIEVENAQLPISVSVGDVDMMLTRQQILDIKETLEVKKRGDHEVIVIPGAKHGFAVRLDPKDEFMVQCSEKAEVQAIKWFERWLS